MTAIKAPVMKKIIYLICFLTLQFPLYSQSLSGAVSNKMQALMIDTNESGDFDSTDLLLFVDNWGGMIQEVHFSSDGIFV